jgi:hypothetical protein
MPHVREIIEHGHIQSAVSELIDDIWNDSQKLSNKLEDYYEKNSPIKTSAEFFPYQIQHCRQQIQRLSAIIMVHHDVMDEYGYTSCLMKATEAQDEYHTCLHIIDVLISNL